MTPVGGRRRCVGVLPSRVAAPFQCGQACELPELAGSANMEGRQGATKVGGVGSRLAMLAALIATTIVVNVAPHAVPAATIRPGAVACAAAWSSCWPGWCCAAGHSRRWRVLHPHVMVSPDQPVITIGPYRVLRHPGYTGFLLIGIGVGLASANWAGLTVMVLLMMAPLLWRIHVEENALLATLGDRYCGYAAPASASSRSSGDQNHDGNRLGLVRLSGRWHVKFMFRNQTFSFEALRAAGFAVYGGADLGEVIVTAQKVRGSDVASWHR